MIASPSKSVRYGLAVAEIGQQALSEADVAALMDRAVALVADTLEVELCGVLERLPDDRGLRLCAGAGWRSGSIGQILGQVGPDSQAGHVLATGEPVVVADVRQEARFRAAPLLRDHGVVSGVSVAIQGHDGPFGVLGAHTAQRRVFSEDDLHFMQAVANTLAMAVERKRAEEERAELIREQATHAGAEAAQRRLAFLSEATTALVDSLLDYEATLDCVARLAVPSLADYCCVDVLEDDGAIRRVTVVHADPAKQALASKLCQYPPDPNAPAGIARVLRTGRAELIPELPSDFLDKATRNAEHRELGVQLGTRSLMIVPLIARDRVFGAIALHAAESGRRYDQADLVLAEELAHRAALAVDNARLYREAQCAISVRDEFLGTVSHELRTPLNHIKGFVSTLRQTDVEWDDETQQDFLAEIEREADRLARLIGDLLDMSRIESGGLAELRRAPARPADLVTGGLDRSRGSLGGRAVTVDLPSELPAVSADAAQVERVVANLIENAAKFSPADAPIRITATQESDRLRLYVDDEGPGIPDEHLERIFDKFFRVKTDRTPVTGTGLGLAICRRIVEAHGAGSGPRTAAPARASSSSCYSRRARRSGPRDPPDRPARRRGLVRPAPVRHHDAGPSRATLPTHRARHRLPDAGRRLTGPATTSSRAAGTEPVPPTFRR
jgi:signal transduction histidine kinase/putative methionine-R-sulfoxide reductase with GAF domain